MTDLQIMCVSMVMLLVSIAFLFNSLTFKASAAIQRGDIEGAKRLYQQYIEKKPNSYLGYLGLATCYFFLADPEQAIAEFDRAYACSNFSAVAYLCRAGALFDLHRYDESKADCDKMIAANCRTDLAYINRSLANFGMKKLEESLADCKQALAIGRGNYVAKSLLNRSLVMAYTGNLEDAIEDCTKAIKVNPKEALAFVFRGHYNAQAKQFDKARSDLDAAKALTCPPRDAVYLFCAQAELELLEGNLENALSNADKALAIKPRWSRALIAHALVLLQKGDNDRALAEINEAIESDPFYGEAYWVRENAYKILLQQEKADLDKVAYERLGYRPPL